MGNCLGGDKDKNTSEKPTEKTKLLDTEKFILLGNFFFISNFVVFNFQKKKKVVENLENQLF